MIESSLSPEQSSEALKAIEQALYNHEQWHEAVLATLVCRLPPDERDTAADAHRKCRFGQWYYSTGAALLGRHPGFEEVEVEHRRMHERAARLIEASARGETIPVQEYERFTGSVRALRLEMLTLKQELEDALYNLDPLTGAASRIGMLTKLREQRELVRRRVQACSIAMMDLDSFKAVNDLHGHQVGDRVLAESARRVMASLRPYDKLFRYGGEEFLVCLPDASLEAAHEIVERLRAAVAQAEHEGNGQGPFRVTASFGLTLLDPDASVETSIERADQALYAAKTRGRDRTVTWSADLAG